LSALGVCGTVVKPLLPEQTHRAWRFASTSTPCPFARPLAPGFTSTSAFGATPGFNRATAPSRQLPT
jgi:hypothetical protein